MHIGTLARVAATAGAALLLVAAAGAGARQSGSPDAALADRGRQVFEQMKCLLCHSLEGKGGKLATPLDGIGAKRNAASLRKLLENPQAEFPDSKVKMPVFPLKEPDREALIAYLLTLRQKRP